MFVDAGFEIQPQHGAFLVSEDDFDGTYRRIVEGGLEHWADPGSDGHNLEELTGSQST